MNTLLRARHLAYHVDGHPLLEDVNLDVQAGELLGVIGPNGAGKSTLLKLLAGVLVPTKGTLLLQDKPYADHAAAARAQTLTWLEQRPLVHWPLTVQQVVALGRLPHGDGERPAGQAEIARALAATGVAHLASRAFHSLSEGEKMLVHLARVLAGESRVLLVDEPVSALDPRHQLQVLELLHTLTRQGMAVVAVLHDLGLAARFCQRLLLLDKGRPVATGDTITVLSPANLASIYRIDAELQHQTHTLHMRGTLHD